MSSNQGADYYEVLQISPNAEPETVHRVFRLLAQRFHPDNAETGNEAQFRTLNARAFMWTAETGRISLQDALIFGGADLNGWTLDSASGISADGRTVVGTASGPGGQQAYVATIGAILEPSTRALSLFAVAALIVVATRKIWQSGLTRKESLVCSHSLT